MAAGLAAVVAGLSAGEGSAGTPAEVWQAVRAAVVAHINGARLAHGVPPFTSDEFLTRVGDRHCWDLIEDGVHGHFSRRGTPPYLRYLLAGGTGYHRQNAASLLASSPVSPAQVMAWTRESVERMLAEQPPNDGHRATLLDPTATHIGVGLAVRGGSVAMTHEVAVHLVEQVQLPSPITQPRTPQRWEGSLPSPWRPRAVEVLWQALPTPLTTEQATAISSYSYPPRQAISFLAPPGAGSPRISAQGAGGALTRAAGNRFSFRWTSRPHPGVEVLILWASRGSAPTPLVAIAATAVVVTEDGTLPPELARWVELRGVGRG